MWPMMGGERVEVEKKGDVTSLFLMEMFQLC